MNQASRDRFSLRITFPEHIFSRMGHFIEHNFGFILAIVLTVVSVLSFLYYYENTLGLSYNDARSHLDIGRRMVEGLKPGFAQLGSVWLPLPHILMLPTIWNNFMWHSGLAGAIQSMLSYIVTGLLIYYFLKRLGVNLLGRMLGVFIFAANLNILYLQATAMTELLLLATMTFGVFELVNWHRSDNMLDLIKSAFWIMLSTLIRYDGWFLLLFAGGLVAWRTFRTKGYKTAEGATLLFLTLGGVGIFLWFVWNLLIFKDPFYFAFGPYSAHAQQEILNAAGELDTKGRLFYSMQVYFHAMAYNAGTFTLILGIIGMIVFLFDKSIKHEVKIASLALIAPFLFNIIALFLGHSVLYVQGLSGSSWFNVRYGIMMLPSIAIFIGYLVKSASRVKGAVIGLIIFVSLFSFMNADAVTIDDARVGASGKNVTEVAGWLAEHTQNSPDLVLISAASHDAIIFSSGLPMKKFIHEGTGVYWEDASEHPAKMARWIIMRSYDHNDLTWRTISPLPEFQKYERIKTYPFADIYALKPEYVHELETEKILGGGQTQ
jgi:hypothetical protein